MITLDSALLDRIFHFVCEQRIGPSRAIPRDKLMALFGLDWKEPDVDRAFRDWYRVTGILSCERGLYAPRNEADIKLCEAYLWPHMSPDRLRERMECIYRAWPKYAPVRGTQLEIF